MNTGQTELDWTTRLQGNVDEGFGRLDALNRIGNQAKPGNSNAGHEFSGTPGPGVIGPELTYAERRALIEYLKTL